MDVPMSTTAGILAVLEVVYVVVLAAWIVLEKRSPVATLAWILALVALPGVGFAIYFFMGPRKIRKRRLRRLRATQASMKPKPSGLAGQGTALELAPESTKLPRELVRVALRVANARLAAARDVVVYTTGGDTFDAIVDAIRDAKHHVHVLYYIYEPDETGRRIRDALVERAKAGVRVRVLLDAVGSSRTRHSRNFFRALREAGGEVAFFNPPGIAQLFGRLLNFRNHRKIVVCDGHVGFTGGINVTDEENDRVNPKAWRDTHVKLVGPCVSWLQVVFLEDWFYATGEAPQTEDCYPAADAANGATVQIIDSGPDGDAEPIKTSYFAAINAAHERVWLSSAYFVPDEALLLALRAAALRGVDVRIIVPRRGDSRTVSAAGRSYYDDLLRAGVHIFEYRPTMLHAKTLLVDDAISFIGTANFDNRSARLNFEVTALIYDTKTASTLADAFTNDLASCKAVTNATRANVKRGARLVEGTARLLSPLL